jgi:hypothetical protein
LDNLNSQIAQEIERCQVELRDAVHEVMESEGIRGGVTEMHKMRNIAKMNIVTPVTSSGVAISDKLREEIKD